MRAHVIENGKVVNTIEVESLDFMPNLVDAEQGGKIGDLWDGIGFSAPPVDIAAAQSERWEAIKEERERRKAAGFRATLGGVVYWFHSDVGSKMQHMGNKDTARDQLAAGGVMSDALLDKETGARISWKTLTPDGAPEVWVPLTCQFAFDIVDAGKAAELAHHRAAEQQKAAMVAAPDPRVYDFMQDADKTKWPVIFGE